MSPRPVRLRKVCSPPVISGFKPYVDNFREVNRGQVFLHYEEYEAIRLCDYEMMNQVDAARLMDVSRPTLTRIYSSARQKVAKAMAEGLQIIIEGGKIYYDSEWYSCKSCGCHFNHPEKELKVERCPLCGSDDFQNFSNPVEKQFLTKTTCGKVCYCTLCGYQSDESGAIPCRNLLCPECGGNMIRKP